MALNACRLCGSPAQMVRRGDLRRGDKWYVEPSEGRYGGSNNVANAPDTRIACTNMECENGTPWNKCDFSDYMEYVWNRANPA